MAKAKDRGQQIGRPALSDNAFLAQHADILAALEAGLSLRKTAEQTGKAINTIRKVRDALQAIAPHKARDPDPK